MPNRSRRLIVVITIALMLGAVTEEASSNRLSGLAIGVAGAFLGQLIPLAGLTAPETPKTASSAKLPGDTGFRSGFAPPDVHSGADVAGEAAAGLPANASPDADLTNSGANGESRDQAAGDSSAAVNASMRGGSPSATSGGGGRAAFGSGPSAGAAKGANSSFTNGSPAQAAGLSNESPDNELLGSESIGNESLGSESLGSARRATDPALPFVETPTTGGVSPLVTSLMAELGQGLLLDGSRDSQSAALESLDLHSRDPQPFDYQAPGFQPSVLQSASADGEWFNDDAFAAADLVTGGLSGDLWPSAAIDLATGWPPTVTLGVASDSLESLLASELAAPADAMVATPEPATLALLGTGLLGVAYRFRDRRSRSRRPSRTLDVGPQP